MNEKIQQPAYCAIGLCNPKSPGNVGSVMRACGCFSADHVFYSGSRYNRAEPFYTDTANARSEIPLTQVDNLTQVSANDIQTVCIELCENAMTLTEFIHPERALYLFGPEDLSLPQDTITAADHVVFIPTKGCLNLAASVNIVLYDRTMKQAATLTTEQSNKLIRHSRDCKNNLKARISQ